MNGHRMLQGMLFLPGRLKCNNNPEVEPVYLCKLSQLTRSLAQKLLIDIVVCYIYLVCC